MTDSKKEFEQWAYKSYFLTDTTGGYGTAYSSARTSGAWEAWQYQQSRVDDLERCNAELVEALQDIARGALQEPCSFESYAVSKAKQVLAKAGG